MTEKVMGDNTVQLLTISKASKLFESNERAAGHKLGKFRQIIHQWLKDGELKGFKLGGRWRFYQHDLEHLLKLKIKNEVQTFIEYAFTNKNQCEFESSIQVIAKEEITWLQSKGKTKDLPHYLFKLAWQYPMFGPTPMMLLVALLFRKCIYDGANEIIFENNKGSLGIKYWVNGNIYNMPEIPEHGEELIFFLKVLSDIDLKDDKKSQKSMFKLKIDVKQVHFHVKSVPTSLGENISIKIEHPISK